MRTETRSRRIAAVSLIVLAISVGPAIVHAQQGTGAVAGRLFNSFSLDPVTTGTVTLEELKQQTAISPDGTYRFEPVPPGTYHLLVEADGYVRTRQEVTVAATVVTLDVGVDPALHYTEVISVSPGARDQFESYQPTSVLSGQSLARELEGTIGATLESQPGIAERSFGPGPSRPVIRGLDGDRVLILEDGQRSGDLSSQSGDHGVNVNPASAERLEIVRGPATLLYGANAIGGLVNVISNDVPRTPVSKMVGGFTADYGTAATDGGGAADLSWGTGRWALHAGGGGRHAGNVNTPDGEVENTQSRSAFGNIGGSWTSTRGYLGGSYGYDDAKYGIPFVEDGNIQLTPRRHVFNLRGESRELTGFVESIRASVGIRRYRHDELEGEEVGTQFTNNTAELEVLAGHRAYGRLKGTFGGWGLTRAFKAVGEEALSPPVDQRGFAGFAYEELTWPHVTFQFGARVEHARFEPDGGLPSATSPTCPDRSGFSCIPPTRRPWRSAWHVRRETRPWRSSISTGRTPATLPSKSGTPASTRNMRSAWTCRSGGGTIAPRVRSPTSGTRSPTTSSATRPVRSSRTSRSSSSKPLIACFRASRRTSMCRSSAGSAPRWDSITCAARSPTSISRSHGFRQCADGWVCAINGTRSRRAGR